MERIRSLPEEKLNGFNYDSWATHMESYMHWHGMWEMVRGDAAEPANASGLPFHRARDARVLGLLRLSVEHDLWACVRDARTAKEAWDHLKALCRNSASISPSLGENMGYREFNLNEMPAEGQSRYVLLQKDNKSICRAKSSYLPFELPSLWSITKIEKITTMQLPLDLPKFQLFPKPDDSFQRREWQIFLKFLWDNNKVAIVESDVCKYYIHSLLQGPEFPHATVFYQMQNVHSASNNLEPGNEQSASNDRELNNAQSTYYNREAENAENLSGDREVGSLGEIMVENKSSMDVNARAVMDSVHRDPRNSNSKCIPAAPVKDVAYRRNFVRTDPSYLRTLSQAHSGWIFGAIAELVDNSRDAKANRLDISVESLYLKKAGTEIPVLSVVDDGHGMSHLDMMRMLSFGHKQPDGKDADHIGRFGIGFKTGAMKLGRDALVLTQSCSSRSIAFLSQSFNENKENVEIPIVTYRKHGQYMEIDLSVQSEIAAEDSLRAIKENSPFNEYLIGQKLGIFGETGTGTQIFIWNLEKWGSNYSLEWITGKTDEGTYQRQGDIFIRSRRIRSRPGQISTEVPLDYSLQAYLEVIFLDPRMKIFVQGSQVKSRSLARSLNMTIRVEGEVMGKTIQLTLGRSKEEYGRVNCGVFLYWHGRLIEAYKRVGSMMHTSDTGRGVIGVADITNIMDDVNGEVWVLNNKQGFQDCEAYAKVEKWIGERTTEYWDDNFDKLTLEKGNQNYEPDYEWVQCNKCRKWRILTPEFHTESLPSEWFCYMPPFNGSCQTPEQQVGCGVITVATGRTGHDSEYMSIQLEGATQRPSSISDTSCSGSENPVAELSARNKQTMPTWKNDNAQNSKNTSRNKRQRPMQSVRRTPMKGKRNHEGDSRVDSLQTDNGRNPRPKLRRLRRGPRIS